MVSVSSCDIWYASSEFGTEVVAQLRLLCLRTLISFFDTVSDIERRAL